MKKIGLYGGSFDPITNGHIWVLRQAAQLFDSVIFSIGVNADKKSYFPISEREKMANSVLKGTMSEFKNIRVHVAPKEYLVNTARTLGATHLIRGIRTPEDFTFERHLCNANRKIESLIDHAYFIPPKDLEDVSSGFVKGLVGYRGWERQIRRYLPEEVYEQMLIKFLFDNYPIEFKPGWDTIESSYSQEKRSYHNYAHLIHMIGLTDHFTLTQSERISLLIAIYWHDVIVESESKNAVEESAELFLKKVCIPMGVVTDPNLIPVSHLIRETNHLGGARNLPSQLGPIIHDLDLAILGADEAHYNDYAIGVRSEYGRVSDSDFKFGRKKALRKLLSKKPLFLTKEFQNLFEAKARENMNDELARL